ncbi:hypothetical protein [Nocardia brasiliensis]|uniref:hypothetical protein n=1 Tax=Nocardia brasiliensis TaxID=37326 RepID=UPI003D92E6C9
MAPRTSKALTAWTELNDRQQGTLGVLYGIEADTEASRNHSAARGAWDATPAAVWRRIDFAHDPADRKLFGTTELQTRLAALGWDNQGNGATMSALADRGLITRDWRPTGLGQMHTVTLTRAGRAAARAGTTLTPAGTPKAALSRRAWEVLALLWAADRSGKTLDWWSSTTIDRVLIGKHDPPLAQQIPGGYEITDRGRVFYREHYRAHTAAHPDVRAPHPDGAQAEPWPAAADDILTRHRQYYRALCAAWKLADTARRAAEQEALAEPVEPDPLLPAELTEHALVRHQLWTDTARQRADLATAHAHEFSARAEKAAHAYAAAALAAHDAAVTGANPLEHLREPDQTDDWDEPRLVPPAETGIHALDAEAKKLYAAAVGKPLRRKGPPPKPRPQRFSAAPVEPVLPGRDIAALADLLHGHTAGGALTRRLH